MRGNNLPRTDRNKELNEVNGTNPDISGPLQSQLSLDDGLGGKTGHLGTPDGADE